ncbi:uncharacterized protein DUF955 [Halanaerobium congolense]|jgi:hypothetical protein|uniref:Uncharacterized protein DUF955 n=1 Tax=Halanaerobium congolense TaxID=54121 RepID=A0A4R8G540_9FIRM|nr:ArdC-like ssDNA-binding domain-containing protein [Halanaerobium congolense]TDX36952.1 uncharacterized protein DUF955 [Halanaerobium congolense]
MSKFKTRELLEKLGKKIESVQSSEEFQSILESFSKFHSYSYHNSLLILTQKPDASFVAGYKQWQQKFNRHVKKGENGIAILAPFSYKNRIEKASNDNEKEKDSDDENYVKKTYFKPVYVFDVSQTEGEDLPEIDTSLDNKHQYLLNPILSLVNEKGVKLKFESLKNGLDGYSKGGEIVINKALNPTEKAAVIIHELAHEILHSREERAVLTKEVKELEAEAVSFVVMDHYNLEIKSDQYLALYKESYDLKDSLKRISKLATSIISYCDQKLELKKS